MTYCLPTELVDKFKKALTSGKINPIRMAKMPNSEARRKYLSGVVGEANAKQVNLLFEKKLLLKNQKRGFVTWAKSVTGIKEPARRGLVNKIEKIEKALNPAETKQFMGDLIEQKLGISITPKEAQEITTRTSEMQKLYQKGIRKAGGGANRAKIRANLSRDYFVKQRDLEKYIDEQTPVAWKSAGWVAEVGAAARTLKATMDISFLMRQGATYFGRSEWLGAITRIPSYAVGESAVDGLAADIMSHEFGDEAMKRKRLLGMTIFGEKMTQMEEAFLSKWATKIPGVAVSERANVGFINDLRAHRFLNTVSYYNKLGKPLSSKEMDELAQTIASASGRGTLGSFEAAAKPLAIALFSPRFFAGRVITLLKPFQKGIARSTRKEAAKNLGTIMGLTVAMMGLAQMAGGDPEWDPRSSDFGKVKFGTTRIDMTAGYGQFIRVMFQAFISKATKSTTTGKIAQINTGDYASRNTWELLTSFIENKKAPLPNVVVEMMNQETFSGEQVVWDAKTMLYFANQLTTPLIFNAMYEAYKESGGDVGLTTATGALEFFGLGVNTYGYQPKDKEFNKIKTEQGQFVYDQVIVRLNENLIPALKELQESTPYRSYDIDQQNKLTDTVIANVKKETLAEYNIEFKVPGEKSAGATLLRAVERGQLGDWADDGSFIDDIMLYARAIGTDPITAFSRIATKQKIRRIDNGAIIVYRIPQSASARIRRELGAGKDEILEHMIPLVLGGSNSRSNLQLVSEIDHDNWTPFEVKLGEMLRAGRITKQEAQDRIIALKEGRLLPSQVLR